MRRTVFFLSLLCLLQLNAQTPQEPRKAALGIWVIPLQDSIPLVLHVDSVAPGLSADRLKLRKGDLLLSLNGQRFEQLSDFYALSRQLWAGQELKVSYRRGDKEKKATAIAAPRPYESSAISKVLYDWVPFRNGQQRAILNLPLHTTQPGVILFIPGYNCGQIENFSSGAYGNLIKAWLEAGYAVFRIEKAGMGDSHGTGDCYESDLATDILIYQAGIKYLKNRKEIDTSRIYLFGHSMGGVIAPELAAHEKVAGIMVFATVFRPWAEFLPEMHRVQQPLLGQDRVLNEAYARDAHRAYYKFFAEKQSREQLWQDTSIQDFVKAEMEYDPQKSETQMWGRHWRFWQQIDSLNLARSWSQVNCPVLSLFGGADWIACSALEHYLITETVNAYHPGAATHITIPDIDHLMIRQSNFKTAVANSGNREYAATHIHPDMARLTLQWLKERD